MRGSNEDLGEFEGFKVSRGARFNMLPGAGNLVDIRIEIQRSLGGQKLCELSESKPEAERKALFADLDRRFEEQREG